MKKVIMSFLISMLYLLSATGCNIDENILHAGETSTQYAGIILDCFKGNSEPDTLKTLFCEKVSSTHNLDDEILSAIEFIDGNIIDDGEWSRMSAGGQAWDNGELTDCHIKPLMKSIKTDTGKIYDISFYAYLVYYNKEYVGITRITIFAENDEEYTIGEVL